MVRLELVPVLRISRELYDMPRGRERFTAYLRAMIGADGELALPLPMLNPMGKAPVAAVLDALLELDAEAIAQAALDDAAARCAAFDDALRVSLVVADDAAGGWTNRFFSDAQHRFESKYFVRNAWAVALLWTSEPVDAQTVRRAVLAAVRRTLRQRASGLPQTLDAMLAQEGDALAFAGESPRYDVPTRDSIARTLAPHRSTRSFSVIFAALYGDDAAQECGYDPLGIPPWGGFDLALAEADA